MCIHVQYIRTYAHNNMHITFFIESTVQTGYKFNAKRVYTRFTRAKITRVYALIRMDTHVNGLTRVVSL